MEINRVTRPQWAFLAFMLAASACTSKNDQPAAQKPEIEMVALPNDPRCSRNEKPILLKVTNRSDKQLNKLTYIVEVKRRGHSDAIYRTSYTDDTIVASGSENGICIEKFAGLRAGFNPNATIEELQGLALLQRVPVEEVEYEVRPLDPIFAATES